MKQKNKNNKSVFMAFLSLFIIFVTIFIGFNLWEKNRKVEYPKSLLVGVWQNISSTGPGWADRFNFYKNGSYSLVARLAKRNEWKQVDGGWRIENDKLILTKSLILESTDGTDNDTHMVEAKEWCKIHNCLITTRLKISMVKKNESPTKFGLNFNIDGVDYWKFSDDPNQDSPAPIGGNTKADEYFLDNK